LGAQQAEAERAHKLAEFVVSRPATDCRLAPNADLVTARRTIVAAPTVAVTRAVADVVIVVRAVVIGAVIAREFEINQAVGLQHAADAARR
jgi:hypothetical protein